VAEPGAAPPTLPASVAGAARYIDAPATTGVFTAEDPFPVQLDLDRLG
jgi:hypothetical protein